MAVEVFDNATSLGTSTLLTAPLNMGDLVMHTQGSASLRLQGGQFRSIVINPQTGESEYVMVTGGQATAQWTVQRAIENSTQRTFPQNSIVKHVITADALSQLARQVASPTSTVAGKWDAIEVTDATVSLSSPQELIAPSAQFGPWAVGKTVCLIGAGSTHATLIAAINSINGLGHAMMDRVATTAVTNARAIIGTDDSAAWTDAIQAMPTKPGSAMTLPEGISIMKAKIQFPQNCGVYGPGKEAAKIVAAAPTAGFFWGPDFSGAAGAPLPYGRSAGFTVDGVWVANTVLFINAVNGSFDDMGAVYAAGDGVICGGQNCTFDNLNSAAHLGSLLALDNGCGGYCFQKPELNFAGKYHIEIRSSRNAEGVGYGVPEYNYFDEGICEARNSFWVGGTIGTSNVLITAGRFNMFNDMNFYLDSWGSTDVVNAMIRIRGASTGAGNPDSGYGVNGDHEFRNCTWTGPGSGVGIEHDNIDVGGNLQVFSSVYRPYSLMGHNIFAGLDYAESHASLTPPRTLGQVSLA